MLADIREEADGLMGLLGADRLDRKALRESCRTIWEMVDDVM